MESTMYGGFSKVKDADDSTHKLIQKVDQFQLKKNWKLYLMKINNDFLQAKIISFLKL